MNGLLPWALACGVLSASIPNALSFAASDPREVVLRGRVVCLDESGAAYGSGEACPDEPDGGWALRTGDGTLHRFSPTDPRLVMLTDERVRSRELQITAWPGEDGRLEIVHLRSVIDGRLHEPYYYCEVCAIRAYTPGPCWCCQEPFEFREPPLEPESPPGP